MEPDAIPRRTALVAVLGMIGWAGVVTVFPGRDVYVPLALYAAVLSAVVIALDPRRRSWFSVTPRALFVGVAGALVMIVGSYVAFALAARGFAFVGGDVRADYARTGIAHNWSVLPMLLIVIVAEELVWRGAVFDRARPWSSGALSVALYTATQIGMGSWVVVALALVCGALWTLERAYTKSLVAPIVTHAIWNVTVLVAAPIVDS